MKWLAAPLSIFFVLGCSTDPHTQQSGGILPTGPGGDPPAYTFRAGASGFEVSIAGEEFRPFWPIGVNYSHAIPGTFPGEFLAKREEIASYIATIGDLGANSLRVYTVQSPIFYEELRKYNLDHPDHPLFLLQGAWLPEPSDLPQAMTDSYFDPAVESWFQDEIEKAVDVVHGNRTIEAGTPENPTNYGRAYGTFGADVSPWLLGWLIGREIEPYTMMHTFDLYYTEVCGGSPCTADFKGEWLSITAASPIDAFITKSLDRLIDYEENHYNEQHAVAFSSWPTLDPIDHAIEPDYPMSTEDWYSLDLRGITSSERFESGVFFSYHAYPYYPEFVMYEPSYQVNDDVGLNPYVGYLKDLREHYEGSTLIIAEIGHPSSQGTAHFAESGLSHGDLNEVQQGEAEARSLRSITSSGLDGAFLFQIFDEWCKRAWVVERLELPRERRRLWYNTMSPEQNFGIMAMKPGSEANHHTIDGLGDDFLEPPQASQEGPPLAPLDNQDPARTLRSVTVDADEGFLQLLIRVESLDPDGNGKVDWDKIDYLIGIDTFRPDKGDSCLVEGCAVSTERRVEFLLRVDSDKDVALFVDQPYDMYGIWHEAREPYQLYHTEANDDGTFLPILTKTNNPVWYDGKKLADTYNQPTGKFRTGPEELESNTNFWYSMTGNTIEIRIPWTLLNVTDPSSRQVADDYVPGTKNWNVELQTSQTPEISVVVASLGGAGEAETAVVDTLPRATQNGSSWLIPAAGAATHTWAEWEHPRYHAYRKRSFDILKESLPSIVPPGATIP